MCRHGQEGIRLAAPLWIAAEETRGEAEIELGLALEERDLFVGQFETQRLDVVHEMLDLAATDDGEDVGRLLHDVCEGHSRQGMRAVLLGDLLECGRHFGLLRALLGPKEAAQAFALLLALLDLLLALELAAAHHVPGCERHAKVSRHRDDFALEVARHNVPSALVHAEGTLALFARVRVGRRHDPSRCVADAQVEDFTLLD